MTSFDTAGLVRKCTRAISCASSSTVHIVTTCAITITAHYGLPISQFMFCLYVCVCLLPNVQMAKASLLRRGGLNQ